MSTQIQNYSSDAEAGAIGGAMTAEFIKNAIALKAQAVNLLAFLNSTTADGQSTGRIAAAGENVALFGIPSGQGGTFYNLLAQASVGIATIVVTIPDDKLAALSHG